MENQLRTKISDELLHSDKRHYVLECATGLGKTNLALQKISQLYSQDAKILIVIPRNVLIQNWIEEFKKWHYEDILSNVTFVTYVSLPKMAGSWDIICFDECHHLSERCREALQHFEVKHSLFLSATLKREHKEFIREWCKEDVEFINVSTKKAIDNDVLPDPKILLIPLELDNKKQECVWYPKEAWKNLPPSKVATFDYKDKWKTKKLKKTPYVLKCTQRQYYNELSGLVDWYKRKNYNPAMKNIWLHKCGQRLQWLSMNKLPFTMKIIKKVHSRFIVFCNTIAESETLRIPAVNSQIGFRNLDRFNSKEINSLVAVNCLNEGCNLVDCKVGIFNAINSSEVMQVQKVGRELRHKAPVIIIPFFKDTREEEIVNKWMQNFDKSLIITKTIDEL